MGGNIFKIKAILISLFLIIPGIKYSYCEELKTIAVLDLKAQNVLPSDSAIVSDFLRTSLVQGGYFRVIDRTNMERILSEHSFQMTGCTDQSCAIEIGKLLNAEYMAIGSYSKIEGTLFITVNVVSVETAQIVMSERKQFKKIGNVEKIVNGFANKIAKDIYKEKIYEFTKLLEFKNSIRANFGYLAFSGKAKDIETGSYAYNLSYRRPGILLFEYPQLYTEVEAGYFLLEKSRVDSKIDFYTATLNLQYYPDISFPVDLYIKLGGGSSYGRSSIKYDALQPKKTETSIDPLVVGGIGFDTSRHYRIGFQFEVLYNYIFMKSSAVNGIKFNAGLSYNW